MNEFGKEMLDIKGLELEDLSGSYDVKEIGVKEVANGAGMGEVGAAAAGDEQNKRLLEILAPVFGSVLFIGVLALVIYLIYRNCRKNSNSTKNAYELINKLEDELFTVVDDLDKCTEKMNALKDDVIACNKVRQDIEPKNKNVQSIMNDLNAITTLPDDKDDLEQLSAKVKQKLNVLNELSQEDVEEDKLRSLEDAEKTFKDSFSTLSYDLVNTAIKPKPQVSMGNYGWDLREYIISGNGILGSLLQRFYNNERFLSEIYNSVKEDDIKVLIKNEQVSVNEVITGLNKELVAFSNGINKAKAKALELQLSINQKLAAIEKSKPELPNSEGEKPKMPEYKEALNVESPKVKKPEVKKEKLSAKEVKKELPLPEKEEVVEQAQLETQTVSKLQTNTKTSVQNDDELWDINFSDKYMEFYQDGKITTDEAEMIHDKNLDGVMLVNSTLKNFNVKGKMWQNVNADGAKLIDSAVDDTIMYNTTLRKANLCALKLKDAQLYDVDMSEASLSGAVFNNSTLYNVNFSEAQAQNLQMEDTFLQTVDFSGTDLAGAKFSNVTIKTLIFDQNTNWENVTCENVQIYDEGFKRFLKLPANWMEKCREITQQLRKTNNSGKVSLTCPAFGSIWSQKDDNAILSFRQHESNKNAAGIEVIKNKDAALSPHITRIDTFTKAISIGQDKCNELSKCFESQSRSLPDKISLHLSISTDNNKTLTCVPHIKDVDLSGIVIRDLELDAIFSNVNLNYAFLVNVDASKAKFYQTSMKHAFQFHEFFDLDTIKRKSGELMRNMDVTQMAFKEDNKHNAHFYVLKNGTYEEINCEKFEEIYNNEHSTVVSFLHCYNILTNIINKWPDGFIKYFSDQNRFMISGNGASDVIDKIDDRIVKNINLYQKHVESQFICDVESAIILEEGVAASNDSQIIFGTVHSSVLCHLSSMRYTGSVIKSTCLFDCDLTRDGELSYLLSTVMWHVNMSKIRVNHGQDADHALWKDIAVRNCNLTEACLEGIRLDNVDIRGSDLTGANLKCAEIRNLVFDGNTTWQGVDGAGAQIYDDGTKKDVSLPEDWVKECQDKSKELKDQNKGKAVHLRMINGEIIFEPIASLEQKDSAVSSVERLGPMLMMQGSVDTMSALPRQAALEIERCEKAWNQLRALGIKWLGEKPDIIWHEYSFEATDLGDSESGHFGLNLKGLNLEGKNLSGINLNHADLEGANLKGANLYKTQLGYANLKDAQMENSIMVSTFVKRADMTNAHLEGAIINDIVGPAKIAGITMSKDTHFAMGLHDFSKLFAGHFYNEEGEVLVNNSNSNHVKTFCSKCFASFNEFYKGDEKTIKLQVKANKYLADDGKSQCPWDDIEFVSTQSANSGTPNSIADNPIIDNTFTSEVKKCLSDIIALGNVHGLACYSSIQDLHNKPLELDKLSERNDYDDLAGCGFQNFLNVYQDENGNYHCALNFSKKFLEIERSELDTEKNKSLPQIDHTESLNLSDVKNFRKCVLRDKNILHKLAKECNLSLENADFKSAHLAGAILEGINLSEAKFKNADLRLANLKGAILKGASLRGASLRGADLTGADLTGADLTGADLTGANLTDANLTGAQLKQINLSRAKLCSVKMENAQFADALLYETDFSGTDLSAVQKDNNTCWSYAENCTNDKPGDNADKAVFGSLRADIIKCNAAWDLLGIENDADKKLLLWKDVNGNCHCSVDVEGLKIENKNLSTAHLVGANLCDAKLTNCTLPNDLKYVRINDNTEIEKEKFNSFATPDISYAMISCVDRKKCPSFYGHSMIAHRTFIRTFIEKSSNKSSVYTVPLYLYNNYYDQYETRPLKYKISAHPRFLKYKKDVSRSFSVYLKDVWNEYKIKSLKENKALQEISNYKHVPPEIAFMQDQSVYGKNFMTQNATGSLSK